ncbi:MAG: diaminopimelate epimerase [Pyrinomonadaceae bacterium]|nr:diaminopimelate epimerase [Pyrinomonadaceae bacterium]
MSSINFCKFQGFGNDYIVIPKANIPSHVRLPDLARDICDRHKGVGADGIAVLERLDDERADYFCEIVNPDGSFAGFSGNGTRCAVAYLYYERIWHYPSLRLETRSGVKNYTLIERESEGHYWFEAEIGKPKFASDQVPIVTDQPMEAVVDMPIEVDGKTFLITGVNVGNPVACTFVDSFDLDWRTYGRLMESHRVFPQRANIAFIKVVDSENIEIRIWERGAGETSASGTVASGSAIVSAFTGRTERTISVVAPGGTTEVHWRDDDEILLTGRADIAFCGEWRIRD